ARFPLAFIAWPKVAEYSNEKPFSQSWFRFCIQAPVSAPLLPRCPSSTRTRLFPSNASMATVFSPISPRSLDVEDLHRVTGEETVALLREEFSLDTRKL